MRFLCLHGLGTSSQLFKKQTAALRYELGDEHSYLYVQGMLPWPMAPELAGISKPTDPHYAYMDPSSAPSSITALDLLDTVIATQGPFDGVLAFSQGAGLAIQYMARVKQRDGIEPFRCAILIAPTNTGDEAWWRATGEMRRLKNLSPTSSSSSSSPPSSSASSDSEASEGNSSTSSISSPVANSHTYFSTPTALIWGARDSYRPDFEDGCELWGPGNKSKTCWRYVHEGGHEVPGMRSKSEVKGAVKVIRRAVVCAELGG